MMFLALHFLSYNFFLPLSVITMSIQTQLSTKNGLRGSPIFVAAARAGEFRKYAVISFPWKKTAFIPFSTGIPPHVMMVAEIEMMKKTITKQTCAIVDSLKTELDNRNIGGDTYQATMLLEEVKRAHEMMYTKLRIITSNVNGGFVYDNPAFQYFFKQKMEKLQVN